LPDGVGLILVRLIDVVKRSGWALLPVLHPQVIGEVVAVFMDIGNPDDMVVQEFGIDTAGKGAEKIIGLGESVLRAQGTRIIQVADLYKVQGIGIWIYY